MQTSYLQRMIEYFLKGNITTYKALFFNQIKKTINYLQRQDVIKNNIALYQKKKFRIQLHKSPIIRIQYVNGVSNLVVFANLVFGENTKIQQTLSVK